MRGREEEREVMGDLVQVKFLVRQLGSYWMGRKCSFVLIAMASVSGLMGIAWPVAAKHAIDELSSLSWVGCVFRLNPTTDSASNPPPVPSETVH